ncbi:tetratricopeptide repeat protein [Prolixibacter sp. NT017]|uniref:type IX secretion system periplasmic lipoprotein PorW/SprE n=1 Tax=Prolixibacter sp. NT017 TaxID=2652390 RepID=UPI001299220E|nr:tetratricopeptide repeat protein [Prolixibacter sp. NT017]
MKLKTRYIFFLLGLSGLVLGCSTSKNTVVSRAYNNLTSHYNIYFNAKESVKSGLGQVDQAVKNDYTHILPLYKASEKEAANAARSTMDVAIMKCSKLITQHSITKKPRRRSNRSERYKEFASKTEFNKWVDDAYLLMGRAYFYKHDYYRAIENFSYVIRNFSKEPIRYDAYLWLARAYNENGQYSNARDIFDLLQGDPNFPKKLLKEFELVQTDYFMKQAQYRQAIPHLKSAVNNRFPRKKKLRYNYILAQLYAETDQQSDAVAYYRKVLKMRPPYEMAFNARINRAEEYTGAGSADDLKKQLRRMLRDEKNEEFRDRIYFAMGKVAMKEGMKAEAIDDYRKSAAYSKNNNAQRAETCLTLARIYFQDENYVQSQSYYDSTLVVIDNTYPGYDEISSRAASLGRLVTNLNTISREDSLQRLAQMTTADRNALIDVWISKINKEEAQKREEERNQQLTQNYYRYNQRRNTIQGSNDGSWYFYNPTTVGIGKEEFRRIWGKRKLEDNWRRVNKTQLSAGDTDQLAEETQSDSAQVTEQRVSDPRQRDYYLQDVPLTDSLMAASNDRLMLAYYNAARIYRSEFNDYQRSAEMLEELDRKFPGGSLELISWFDLYQIYKTQKETADAAKYEQLIVAKYPNSKYAKFLKDPNYFVTLEAQRDSMNRMYSKAFSLYQDRDFKGAAQKAHQLLAMHPDTGLVAKTRFLEVVSKGTQQARKVFADSLKAYIAANPHAETLPLANKIYGRLQDSTLADYQKMLAEGYIHQNIQNPEVVQEENQKNDEFGGKFSYKEDVFHYFVIVFPRQAKVDVNRLIFDIANYDIDYYTQQDFDIEKVNLNARSQMVVVRSLPDKEEGLIYFRSIIRKRNVFETLKGVEYVNFIASSPNYRTLLADHDYHEYLKFFMKNYSRYISSDFPQNELPNPEELLAKARKQEEPEEKGQFVMVKPTVDPNSYHRTADEAHQFVLIPENTKQNLQPLQELFAAFDSTNYADLNLAVVKGSVSGKPALLVTGLTGEAVAKDYFGAVVKTRELFAPLNGGNYRNFYISDTNMKLLEKKKNIDGYMDFFSRAYLGKIPQPKEPESKPQTTAPETQTQPATPVAKPAPSYNGPYHTNLGDDNRFILVFPAEGVDLAKLQSGFEKFNTDNFGSGKIKVEAEPLDTSRMMLVISGLGGKESSMVYFRKVIASRPLFTPLEDKEYRNFVISAANEKILKQKKNLTPYLEFFGQFYLKN